MKGLLKIVVVLLISSSPILASHYRIEEIDVGYRSIGTYYKGYAWVFWGNSGIHYTWYRLEDNGNIKWMGHSVYRECEFTDVQPACCVFQDKIYLFWYEKGIYPHRLYYAVFDGSHWSGKTRLSRCSMGAPYGMAAAVMGNRLFLFYQGKYHIMFLYTSDGKHWSDPKLLPSTSGHKYKTGGNIAAVTYFDWSGDDRIEAIRLAWPTRDNKKIRNGMFYRDDDGNYYFASADDDILNQYATAVALASGSVEGAGTGTQVQIFAVGKTDPWTNVSSFLRAEYNVDRKRYSGWEKGASFLGKPDISTVTNYRVFGDKGHNLRKEIWMLYSGHCVRWNSDQCVQIQDTSQQLYDEEAYKKYWTLIGVVEGPPPYALNGRDPTSDDVSSYSSISYATETDSAVSTSSTTQGEFFISSGGPGEFWPGVGVSYTLALEHHFCKTHTYSTKLTHTFKPGTDTTKFWVYRYYLRPTLRRLKYEIRDWKGNSLDRYAYIFSISDYNLHVDAINMKDSLPYNPRIWDPSTYQDRRIRANTSHYHIKAGRNINWVIDSEVELEISEAEGLESSQSFTQTIEIEVGMEGIFDIGVKGSVSFEHEISTDSINTVTVRAASPSPPAGYSGKYIKEFSFTPYWLEPKDSHPYWIPKEFKHQRPWCITYEVTEIVYDEAEMRGLAEEPLPSLKLYAISPNPSGSEITIRYELPEEAKISLKVYDVNGRLVKVLVDKEQNSGIYNICWDGRDEKGRKLANGVYFCRLEAGNKQRISRIVLIR